MSTQTNALPDKSTLHLTPVQRSISRLVNINAEIAPAGSAELDLLKDTFHSLFQYDPAPLAEPEPERQVNSKLLDWLRKTQGFANTRANTAGSILVSARTAAPLWQILLKDEALKAAIQDQELAEQEAKYARDSRTAAREKKFTADAMRQAGFDKQADELVLSSRLNCRPL